MGKPNRNENANFGHSYMCVSVSVYRVFVGLVDQCRFVNYVIFLHKTDQCISKTTTTKKPYNQLESCIHI